MAEIALEKLTKVYGDGTRAVSELDLEIADGEFVVLVGPSGCGKTSALRMIAGLEEITGGTVRVGEQVVNDLPPKARDMAMVFQNYALYPHMNVYDNMGFGLKMRGFPKAEIKRRVGDAARVLGLTEVLSKRPRHLSGGQRQRVAMGRAIVREPKAFLMDEPLSNLDAKLRVEMRAEIARLQRELGVTTIYVTHDQVEAMTLGDRVAIMRDGVVIFGPHTVRVDESVLGARPGLRRYAGRTVALGIRPEDVEDAAFAPDSSPDSRLAVTVDIKEDMGSEVILHFAVDATPVKTEAVAEVVTAEAIEAGVAQTHERGTPFVARVERGTQAREGGQVELAVDTRRLHFFDLESGEGIYGEVAAPAPAPVAA